MSFSSHLKVAVLSDTHGVIDQRILDLVADSDWLFHAGDIGNAGVLRQLAQIANKVLAVRGNNDIPSKWPIEDHAILAALPHEHRVILPGGELVMVHGHRLTPASQRHGRLRQYYPEAKAVVYGHSHRLVKDTAAEPWILNPGAAGRARTYGGPSCLLLHIDSGKWHVEQHRFKPK